MYIRHTERLRFCGGLPYRKFTKLMAVLRTTESKAVGYNVGGFVVSNLVGSGCWVPNVPIDRALPRPLHYM